ncbi:hypothetical protein XJ32_01185 [Helicobacter bilis]|uniref:Uncharacterized protein n=1 Tax=Helicobacter bilis TaxID=37372 RepID=A0A1Q2LET1_9HELI|nr:hypothetical protein XJ32_01185 [Helicobacter bilis]
MIVCACDVALLSHFVMVLTLKKLKHLYFHASEMFRLTPRAIRKDFTHTCKNDNRKKAQYDKKWASF